jgi:hypothetical protein
MNTFTLSNFSMAALLTLAGCSGAVDVVSTSEGDEPVASRATAGELPLSIRGVAHDADGNTLAGVHVCLQAGMALAMDIGDCATSEADGAFILYGIPLNRLVTIGFQKGGFLPTIRAIRTGTTDIGLPPEESVMRPASIPPAIAGVALDDSTGAVEFFVDSDGAEPPQANVSIVSYDDPNSIHEPVYLDASGVPAPGAKGGSFGAFVGLPTGLYAVTFSTESGSCKTLGGLYGEPIDYYQNPGQASILVPVVGGLVTTPIGVDCSGSAAPVAR